MAKQFLMKRISSFKAVELSDEHVEPGATFAVPAQMRSRFFDHLCEEDPVVAHLQSYPPVALYESARQHEPECKRRRHAKELEVLPTT